jgi:hypothetical protein
MLIPYHNESHTNLLASLWGLWLIFFAALGLKAGGKYCLAHYYPIVNERIICMCEPPSLTIEKEHIPPIRPITPKTIFIMERACRIFAPPVILPTDDIRYLPKKTKKSRFHRPKFTAIPLITPCIAQDSIPSDSLFRTLRPNEQPSIEPSDTTLIRGN